MWFLLLVLFHFKTVYNQQKFILPRSGLNVAGFIRKPAIQKIQIKLLLILSKFFFFKIESIHFVFIRSVQMGNYK